MRRRSLQYYNNGQYPVKLSFLCYKNGANQSPPLIILHDILGFKENWSLFAINLSKKIERNIYIVDCRNHGNSPRTDSHNVDLMIADCLKFVNWIGASKVCLLGHGMGGYVVMKLALVHPERVDHLIIVDTSPIIMLDALDHIYKIFGVLMTTEVPFGYTNFMARRYIHLKLNSLIKNKKSRELLALQLIRNKTGETFNWIFNIFPIHESIAEYKEFYSKVRDLPPFTGSTHFISASRSKFLKIQHWHYMMKMFPFFKNIWVNGGHMLFLEDLDQFINVVIDALK